MGSQLLKAEQGEHSWLHSGELGRSHRHCPWLGPEDWRTERPNVEGVVDFRGKLSQPDPLWMKHEGSESSELQAHPKAHVCLKGTG